MQVGRDETTKTAANQIFLNLRLPLEPAFHDDQGTDGVPDSRGAESTPRQGGPARQLRDRIVAHCLIDGTATVGSIEVSVSIASSHRSSCECSDSVDAGWGAACISTSLTRRPESLENDRNTLRIVVAGTKAT